MNTIRNARNAIEHCRSASTVFEQYSKHYDLAFFAQRYGYTHNGTAAQLEKYNVPGLKYHYFDDRPQNTIEVGISHYGNLLSELAARQPECIRIAEAPLLPEWSGTVFNNYLLSLIEYLARLQETRRSYQQPALDCSPLIPNWSEAVPSESPISIEICNWKGFEQDKDLASKPRFSSTLPESYSSRQESYQVLVGQGARQQDGLRAVWSPFGFATRGAWEVETSGVHEYHEL